MCHYVSKTVMAINNINVVRCTQSLLERVFWWLLISQLIWWSTSHQGYEKHRLALLIQFIGQLQQYRLSNVTPSGGPAAARVYFLGQEGIGIGGASCLFWHWNTSLQMCIHTPAKPARLTSNRRAKEGDKTGISHGRRTLVIDSFENPLAVTICSWPVNQACPRGGDPIFNNRKHEGALMHTLMVGRRNTLDFPFWNNNPPMWALVQTQLRRGVNQDLL